MDELTSIEALTAEILILKKQTAENIIGIGERLIKAKESLPHGEWLPYLKDKVEFSQQTANNFMRVAKELPNYQTFSNLSQSKIFALLELPQEERQDFIDTHPVEKMSVREIKDNIKAENQRLKLENFNLGKQLDLANAKPAKVIEKVIEKEVTPKDYEKIKTKLAELEARSKTLDAAKLELNEYKKAKKKIEDEVFDLQIKMQKAVKQDEEIATQAYVLSEITRATESLRKHKANLEIMFKRDIRMSELSKREVIAQAEFLMEMSKMLYDYSNRVIVEVFAYGRSKK